MKLVLPVPPGPNQWKRHPMALHRQKMEYQREAWLAAIRQHKPMRDPPEHVEVRPTLYLSRKIRDEDNAAASVKFALDALRQKQQGDLKWREGIAHLCGYFIDDDAEHMTLCLPVEQIRVKTDKERRLELEITVQPRRTT